jgi:hypothetical protein
MSATVTPLTFQPPEIPERECVARFGLIARAVGEREVPRRVFVPAVGLEERVLLGGA